MTTQRDADLEGAILSLVRERPDRSIDPTEAARLVGGPHPDGWGPLMQPLRKIAVRLALDGKVLITRKGKAVDPSDFRGVYRLQGRRVD
jgi:hypothetical protein